MNNVDFYQNHLNKVSRSFAFCIPRLEGNLREWIGLSYLLCRLLDTVEDALWTSHAEQLRSFEMFQSFIEKDYSLQEVTSWATQFPSTIPEGEKALLADAYKFFSDLHKLPVSVREKIRRSVLNMLRGMRHFTHRVTTTEKIRLHNLSEVNQYCFFVAGLVGELLTDLVAEKHSNELSLTDLHLKAVHFGLFLQKINLLKDQRDDEREGRFLIHSRPEVLASLKRDAEGSIQYILSLPVNEKGFRLFCAWCLFLGLASLPWIQKSWAIGILKKIPRLVTEQMLSSVELQIDDNAALLNLFYKKLPKLPPIQNTSFTTISEAQWFSQAYVGALTSTQLEELVNR